MLAGTSLASLCVDLQQHHLQAAGTRVNMCKQSHLGGAGLPLRAAWSLVSARGIGWCRGLHRGLADAPLKRLHRCRPSSSDVATPMFAREGVIAAECIRLSSNTCRLWFALCLSACDTQCDGRQHSSTSAADRPRDRGWCRAPAAPAHPNRLCSSRHGSGWPVSSSSVGKRSVLWHTKPHGSLWPDTLQFRPCWP